MRKQKKARVSKFNAKPILSVLQPGDTIEIIAPGSHAPLMHLEKGAQVLRNWGFNVIYNSDILNPQIFLSNTDEYRFQNFKQAMLRADTKAVWCLRGGYGSIRLLPMIAKMKKPKNPKLLIGLSDITSLQTIITQNWNFPTLHASLIDRLALEKLTEKNIEELKSVLLDANFKMKFSNLQPLNLAAQKPKTISARVTGGNLMVVTSTLGTAYQLQSEGKIIFLEELCERAYRIDRCLQQLKQANVFSKAKAIVFGDFTNCDEPNKENYVQEILEKFSGELKIPAFRGIENGHGDLQRPLFFNSEAQLTCAAKGEMLVFSPFTR